MYADGYQGMSARPLTLTAAGSGQARQHPLASQRAQAPAALVPAALAGQLAQSPAARASRPRPRGGQLAQPPAALVLAALVPGARNRLPGLQPGRHSRRSGSSPRQRQSH